MIDLKTLKDFLTGPYRGEIAAVCALKDTRQEAIKYLKYYQMIKYNEPNYAKRRIQMQWIKEFFNITEEDLK